MGICGCLGWDGARPHRQETPEAGVGARSKDWAQRIQWVDCSWGDVLVSVPSWLYWAELYLCKGMQICSSFQDLQQNEVGRGLSLECGCLDTWV